MIYLFLNVVFSSFFILCIRWVQLRKNDVVSVGMVNYLVAGAITLIVAAILQPPFTLAGVTTGAANGICYFVAFFFLNYAVRFKGAANITIVTRLSILFPILFGIWIWNEWPDAGQATGILLACVSLVLISRRNANLDRQETPPYAWAVLLVFFLIAGGSRLSQEAFRNLCEGRERAVFLMVAFVLTAIAALGVNLYRRRWGTMEEWSIGIVLGVSNLVQTFLILKALEAYPGYIVFPVVSAGSLVFTTLVAVGFLREQLSWESYAGIFLASGSLVLLNL